MVLKLFIELIGLIKFKVKKLGKIKVQKNDLEFCTYQFLIDILIYICSYFNEDVNKANMEKRHKVILWTWF